MSVKTDSFVVESNVHFPTDYNLLWDAARKVLDITNWFVDKYPSVDGWRKSKDWQSSLKNLSRSVGQASASGGKGKKDRLKKVTKQYLVKARALNVKINKTKDNLPIEESVDLVKVLELEKFITMLEKHIDLVERRLLKGESIPHEEKVFSLFEEYTEFIKKGKSRPNVELGKKLSITTDQYGLIIDYHIMEHESDSQIVLSTADRLLNKYNLSSWSFDKGYWHKDNKWLLSENITNVIMPKKGKLNKTEYEQEHTTKFKKLRHKHSAIESNINELEHNGLDRCPDRGFHGFKRYIGIGITAHNLQRIGKELIKKEKATLKKTEVGLFSLVA